MCFTPPPPSPLHPPPLPPNPPPPYPPPLHTYKPYPSITSCRIFKFDLPLSPPPPQIYFDFDIKFCACQHGTHYDNMPFLLYFGCGKEICLVGFREIKQNSMIFGKLFPVVSLTFLCTMYPLILVRVRLLFVKSVSILNSYLKFQSQD